MLRTLFVTPILWGTLFAAPASADPFYEAALCKPPYTTDTATALYEAAEKLAKPDTSMLGAYVYRLPRALGQDGFASSEVIFAGTAVGVLIEGARADALAERYGLTKERSTLLGTATKGYSRALPQDQQPQPDLGIVSIVARESPALPGKTLLACELVFKADQEALDRYEKSRTP
ncbi:hypothetical protein ACQKOH_22870 [Sphingomonas sp. NPDC092331]|jgi:hypothetical protein|uniref:hypothetical protein n=1 Tax=unclassified Sphingomonas TaxID=196159 RepID=UPI0031F5B753